jgi:serine/tyrosine/threonine adenylyltransferase
MDAPVTRLFPFDNSFARLPERFYARLPPTPVREPKLIKLNVELARDLNLDPAALASPEGVAVMAGNAVAEGSDPLAAAYAGHQFGNFVPQLGDGRAILLGEVIGRDGIRYDIQLKGAGPTPFSRRGDGRAALGPVLREYIVSEAMAALGVPTTRALAALSTGEVTMREEPLPGAIVVRVAQSHVRVGSFQYFAAHDDVEGVKILADYVIARHYPEAARAANPYRALLDSVIARQATLIAQWLCLGFIHGVMNTDNMTISGETIDYGPCAFMDAYHPATVFSSIDAQGRYAYGNQPRIAVWNLTRLAETLLPLIDANQDAAIKQAEEALGGFRPVFEKAYSDGLSRKLGLMTARDGDFDLANELLGLMAQHQADFTLTFRRLCDAAADAAQDEPVRELFVDPTAFDAWATKWRARLAEEGGDAAARRDAMRAANPMFIPRNHRVEEAIVAATAGDFAPFETLVKVLSRPYDDQPDFADYAKPPREDQMVQQTFCGT